MDGGSTIYSLAQVADIFSVPDAVVSSWEKSGKLTPSRGHERYAESDLKKLDTSGAFFQDGSKTPNQ
ncbi:MAG: MerR family transcriptional regulator [Luteolibacter sp.]